jgi:hypothetical protein
VCGEEPGVTRYPVCPVVAEDYREETDSTRFMDAILEQNQLLKPRILFEARGKKCYTFV